MFALNLLVGWFSDAFLYLHFGWKTQDAQYSLLLRASQKFIIIIMHFYYTVNASAFFLFFLLFFLLLKAKLKSEMKWMLSYVLKSAEFDAAQNVPRQCVPREGTCRRVKSTFAELALTRVFPCRLSAFPTTHMSYSSQLWQDNVITNTVTFLDTFGYNKAPDRMPTACATTFLYEISSSCIYSHKAAIKKFI